MLVIVDQSFRKARLGNWPNWVHVSVVGRSPTFAGKNGRLGVTRIPEFVPLQKICSPIRLQGSSGLSGC